MATLKSLNVHTVPGDTKSSMGVAGLGVIIGGKIEDFCPLFVPAFCGDGSGPADVKCRPCLQSMQCLGDTSSVGPFKFGVLIGGNNRAGPSAESWDICKVDGRLHSSTSLGGCGYSSCPRSHRLYGACLIRPWRLPSLLGRDTTPATVSTNPYDPRVCSI